MSRQKLFARLLTRYINRAGLTNVALAARIGMREGSVRHWLSGNSIPHHDKVPAIADALGIDDPDEREGLIDAAVYDAADPEVLRRVHRLVKFLPPPDSAQ